MENAEMHRLVCGQRVFARHQAPSGPAEFKHARFIKIVRIPSQWRENGTGIDGHHAYDLAQVEDVNDATIRWLVTAGQLRSA